MTKSASSIDIPFNKILNDWDLKSLSKEKQLIWHQIKKPEDFAEKYPRLMNYMNDHLEKIFKLSPKKIIEKFYFEIADHREIKVISSQDTAPLYRIEFSEGQIAFTTLHFVSTLLQAFYSKFSILTDKISEEASTVHTFKEK